MKVIGKVKMKDEFSLFDIGNIVDSVAELVINKNERGEIIYKPYYFDIAMKISLAFFGLEGVEFEDDDDYDDIVNKDKVIAPIIQDFIDNNPEVDDITGYVFDVIELKKQEYIHTNDELNTLMKTAVQKENLLNDMLLQLAKSQNKVLMQEAVANEKQEEVFSKMDAEELAAIQKKLASGEFNVSDMVAAVVEAYLKEDKGRDKKYKEIIDEKNKKILELEKYRLQSDSVDDGK